MISLFISLVFVLFLIIIFRVIAWRRMNEVTLELLWPNSKRASKNIASVLTLLLEILYQIE